MSTPPTRRPRPGLRRLATALLGGLLIVGLIPAPVLGVAQILDVHEGLGELDKRRGLVQPTAGQRQAAAAMQATVRWNRFGTPQSLIRYGGFLASGVQGANAVAAARSWVVANKALFRMASVTTSNLRLESDAPLVGSNGHVVSFRQWFGGLPAGRDGRITVALTGSSSAGWRIAYVSSSAPGTQAAPTAPTISATDAWLTAAANIGRTVGAGDLGEVRTTDGWKLFDVEGFSHPGRARLTAIPVPGGAVRAAFETIVLDVQGGESTAYRSFVDGATNKVVIRENRVQHLADGSRQQTVTAERFAAPQSSVFSGEWEGGDCAEPHGPYTAPAGTQSIDVAADSPGNDIILKLQKPVGTDVASSDIPAGPNPEALHYAPPGGPPAGDYYVQVCPFGPEEPAPHVYAGQITINDAAPGNIPYPPRWKFFRANPPLDHSDTDTRIIACWENPEIDPDVPHANCRIELGPGSINHAARAPWDDDPSVNGPTTDSTFTTIGNAAVTGEAWFSPLTPAEQYRPVRTTRQYTFPWQNEWFDAQCSQAVFAPEPGDPASPLDGGNDIDAAIVNLFSEHNRMHDWSYYLGFDEEHWNLQQTNFGNSGLGGDPETGNAQAGAVDGGFPSYTGRDNANQITLNDGIPGITNMYLWQPVAAAFYAPCTDGDYDMSVIGHEYTHAISNRMVAGPDGNITSPLGGAMGESWSDLTAVEYLAEYGFSPTAGESPFAVGPYVTGSPQKGIRNYNMSNSPLNFSNVGYDFVCNAPLTTSPPQDPCDNEGRTQVHADGEIWSAVNFDIRQAMIARYNGAFPASDKALQRSCADGTRRDEPERCPGNRRWIQLVFDAYLMLQGDLSMLDARDAMLGADALRFGGANQALLWRAFAKRGMGQHAAAADGADIDPKPDFTTPIETNEVKITFRARAVDQSGAPAITNAKVFVGRYEAGITPIADTRPDDGDAATPEYPNFAHFVPGTYQFFVQADGFGLQRLTTTIAANSGHRTIVVDMPTNWASRHRGATVAGDGINKFKLIDDTEATNWFAATNPATVQGTDITVDLAGANPRLVGRVRVSAMLRPRNLEDPGDDPQQPNVGDTEGQSRFSALRSFRIQTCRESVTSDCVLTGWTTVGTFPDAFPGKQPRPLAPDLQLREFDVTDSMATHVRLVVLDNQCTAEGTPFQGEQDEDPTNDTDCDSAVFRPGAQNPSAATRVRAAELQVLSSAGSASQQKDPVVPVAMTGPATAATGDDVPYSLSFTNLGPEPSSNAKLVASLPEGVAFRSASAGGTWDATKRTVTWSVGTIPVHFTGTRSLTVRVRADAGAVLLTTAQVVAPLTVSPPGAAVTIVE
jgi:extracellular elastinolytic metalloproteinase